MKILFINPTSKEDPTLKTCPRIPYAFLYLAPFIEREGHSIKIIDRNVNDDDEFLKNEVKHFSPDVVGLSVLTGRCILDAIQISRGVKKINKNIAVIWGGVHVSLFPEKTLAEEFVDYVVIGEGEYTLPELLLAIQQKRDIRAVKGIFFKEKGVVCKNELRPSIRKLDDLLFPSFHLLDLKPYLLESPRGIETIMNTSRGCIARCNFCYINAFASSGWRGLSSHKVIEQMEYLYSNHGVRNFIFRENMFTADKRRVVEICNYLIKNKMKISWYAVSRVGKPVTFDLLRKMKESGCYGLNFGVESLSQKVLDLMNKKINVEEIFEMLKLCKRVGINVDINIMVGYPGETIEDFLITQKRLKKLPYHICDLMVYIPYPGSDTYEKLVSEGIFVPPKRLEGWAYISEMHDSGSYHGNAIPRDLISKSLKQNRIRNEFIWKKEAFSNKLKDKNLFKPGNFIRNAQAVKKTIIEMVSLVTKREW